MQRIVAVLFFMPNAFTRCIVNSFGYPTRFTRLEVEFGRKRIYFRRLR